MEECPPPDARKPCTKAKPFYLAEGARLCRIYNHTKGYDCLSWNDTISSAKKGGRFDATTADAFKYMYGAQATDSTDVAVWETIIPLAEWNYTKESFAIARRELEMRSLVYFHCNQMITLADLTSPEGRKAFNAPPSVCTIKTRSRTRLWGAFMRANAPDIQGFAYNSSELGAVSSDVSFVLFRDRLPTLNFIQDGEIPLTSQPGLNIIREPLWKAHIDIL